MPALFAALKTGRGRHVAKAWGMCFVPPMMGLLIYLYGRKGHLGILRENRTVLYIALIVFATQVVATVLDLNFVRLVQDALPDKDLRLRQKGAAV